LPEKAVLKVFTTGSVTLTGKNKKFYFVNFHRLRLFFFLLLAPSVERINTAVNEIYPQLFECRKINRDEQQC
jgi:hypothetical protein